MRYWLDRTSKRAIALALLLVAAAYAQRPEPIKTMIKGHLMYTVLKPGDIPAIFEPEFIPVSEATKYYYPDEPLIAVAGKKTAKAYSTWHLDHHEVVNDVLDGQAITVTW